MLYSNPTGLQSQIPWDLSVPLPDAQVGKYVGGPRKIARVCEKVFYIIVLQSMGHLLSASMMGLMVTSQAPYSQVSTVIQLCLTLCNTMDCIMPGFPTITNSESLIKLMSIKSVMPSNHLIICHPLHFLLHLHLN